MFGQMVQLQLQLFLLMVMGLVLRKKRIICADARRMLSNLLINIIIPCNIIYSFMLELEISTQSLILNCLVALAVSSIIQLIAACGSKVLFRRFPEPHSRIMSYGMIVSNSSFIGIPVAESIFGSLGVLYSSIFQIPIRLTMWTAGLALFTEADRKDALRKLIRHPCIIAVEIGILLMLLPVDLPVFVEKSVYAVSRCSTFISMMVIGSLLADADWKHLLNKATICFCFWRLIGFTALVLAMLRLLQVDNTIVGLSAVMTGMPAGTLTAILAEQYAQDSEFAAGLVFVSTILSMFTIPLLCLFL